LFKDRDVAPGSTKDADPGPGKILAKSWQPCRI